MRCLFLGFCILLITGCVGGFRPQTLSQASQQASRLSVCIANSTKACSAENGSSSCKPVPLTAADGGPCGNPTSCNGGYNLKNGTCVTNVLHSPGGQQSCIVGNGTGSQTCNSSGSAWSVCSGTINVCTPNSQQSCPIANGTGLETCNSVGSSWGPCQVASCRSGFQSTNNSCTSTSPAPTPFSTDLVQWLANPPQVNGVPAHIVVSAQHMSLGETAWTLIFTTDQPFMTKGQSKS